MLYNKQQLDWIRPNGISSLLANDSPCPEEGAIFLIVVWVALDRGSVSVDGRLA